MGDLIIKPASSGSLKIQDQAGTDFITTGTSSGLTLDSGVTFPAGHILKVEKTAFSIESGSAYDTTTSTSYTSTGLSVAITPLNTNTKILILGSFGVSSNSSTYYLAVNIYRSGTAVTDEYLLSSSYNAFGRAYVEGGTITPVHLDSPSNSDLSAITYTVHIKVNGGTGYFGSSSAGSIIVCEVKS